MKRKKKIRNHGKRSHRILIMRMRNEENMRMKEGKSKKSVLDKKREG